MMRIGVLQKWLLTPSGWNRVDLQLTDTRPLKFLLKKIYHEFMNFNSWKMELSPKFINI